MMSEIDDLENESDNGQPLGKPKMTSRLTRTCF